MDAIRPRAALLRRLAAFVVLAGPVLAASPAAAQQESAEEWLESCREDAGRRGHCEVRESTLASTGRLSVDASPNGGIMVRGWDRNEVLVRARVRTEGGSQEEARALASEVSVIAEPGRVRSDGPRTRGRLRWSVSYEVFVPRRSGLDLSSTNGGLRVAGVEGEIELSTTNGGISLEQVAGAVRGRTTNGGVDIRLAGDRWNGSGLDLATTNGGIVLTVPENYSARLEARTVNGGMDVEVPVTVQGRIGRRLETDLGSGGAPIRLQTTNGGVRIRRG